MILSGVIGGFLVLLFFIYRVMVLRPGRLRSRLQQQGIKRPPSHFLFGNVAQAFATSRLIKSKPTTNELRNHAIHHHNWFGNAFPFIQNWHSEYGSIFMYSFVHKHIVCTSDLGMVREVCLSTSFDLLKSSITSEYLEPLLGRGILTSNGSIWKHHRKIIAPELYPDKVKDMVGLMVESAMSMLSSWESRIESEGGTATITVDKDLKALTADILCRACFGSNYSRGEEIFSKIESLVQIMTNNPLSLVPVLRNLPTKTNRAIWKARKEVDSLILNVARERAQATTQHHKDLLQMILEGARSGKSSSDVSYEKFTVDNCKNMYLAGSETPAVGVIWVLALLAANPDWQSKARSEVLRVCKDGRLDVDSLQEMKIVKMVIQETLRLYPPTAVLAREASADVCLNGVLIPKGVGIHIPMPIVHQNPDIWGPDAHKFNPERFAQGLADACKIPQVYMPFGVGNHVCTGQHFAMTELKVITSLILSKFQFSLSPLYVHSPVHKLLLVPEQGLTLSVSSL